MSDERDEPPEITWGELDALEADRAALVILRDAWTRISGDVWQDTLDENKKLKSDLAANAKMLARQCDLAREAEHALAALRQPHAEEVESAFKAGMLAAEELCEDWGELPLGSVDAAWHLSEMKARLA